MVTLLPTRPPSAENSIATGPGDFGTSAADAFGDATGPTRDIPQSTHGETTPSTAAKHSSDAGARQADDSRTSTSSTQVPVRDGVTRAGFPCQEGTRQIPWSDYAAPCVPAWSGDNGGATWNGVSADTIRVVVRNFAQNSDSGAINVVASQAGVDREANRRMQREFVAWMNEVFELYGRSVELIEYTSSANPFDEANGRGREQACADATHIAEELEAFAVIPIDGIAFGPFTECGAAEGLVMPISAYGFPQDFYQRLHPYAWGIQMSCTRIQHHFAEYVRKRLLDRPATFAGDLTYQTQTRRFGMIRPDIEHYFPCHRLLEDLFEDAGIEVVSTYDYVLDPATLPTQMNQAVVQFRSDGVNSLLSIADFLTMINLTQAAARQNWSPEWILQGSGQQDRDNWARLYDQSVVAGHMFGMSQIGDPALEYGTDGEMARSYSEATGNRPPGSANGNYFHLLLMFNQLQMAGPNLNPQTLADGTFRLPPAGSTANGRWNFNVLADGSQGYQHTAIVDAREVYWDNEAEGPDGRAGTFVSTMDGVRFTVGNWPTGDPQVYPDR